PPRWTHRDKDTPHTARVRTLESHTRTGDDTHPARPVPDQPPQTPTERSVLPIHGPPGPRTRASANRARGGWERGQSRPASRISSATWVRLFRSSLARMREMCALTVAMLISSDAAISALDLP